MKMSNEMYDFLRALTLYVLPAIAAFYRTLAGIWGLPLADAIPETIMAVIVCLNGMLGDASKKYYQEQLQSIEIIDETVELTDDGNYKGNSEVGEG